MWPDLDEHLPKCATFDWSNCRHIWRESAGQSASGKEVARCLVCRASFTRDPEFRHASFRKIVRIGRLMMAGRSSCEISRQVGMAQSSVYDRMQQIRNLLACYDSGQ